MDMHSKLPHLITHWPREFDASGQFTFNAPDVMAGRWNGISEQFVDGQGTESLSKAKVTLEADVSEGDFLYWGESDAGDPRNVPGAEEVRRFIKVPDLRSNDFLRRAFL